MNVLGEFELVRRILNHEAVLPLAEFPALLLDPIESSEAWVASLITYAVAVKTVARRAAVQWPTFPAPVIPVVDIANERVTHTTCTGNTHIVCTRTQELRVSRSWNSSLRDTMLSAVLHGTIMKQPKAPLFFDDATLAVIGYDVDGQCVARCHGELAVYAFDADAGTMLITPTAVFRDYEHNMTSMQWMAHAPRDIVTRAAACKF